MQVQDVLWVSDLRCSLLSVSTIEAKGFDVILWKGKVMLKPSRSNSSPIVVLGVKENGLYRLKGKPFDQGKKKVSET